MGFATPPSEDDKIARTVSNESASKISSEPMTSHSGGSTACTRNDGVKTQPTKVRERLEDVFQDEIVRQFGALSEFKKFARSKDGLRLSNYDVENIAEDYPRAEPQRLQLLYLWKQKQGKQATPQKIRDIVQQYKDRNVDHDDDD